MTDRVERFVASIRDDPRVLGIASLGRIAPTIPELLVVTTWDGFETLPGHVAPEMRSLVGGDPVIERRERPTAIGPTYVHFEDFVWTGLGAGDLRAEIRFRRIGDLVPSWDGVEAELLYDPHEFLATWKKYSRSEQGADRLEARFEERDLSHWLAVDYIVRGARPNPGADVNFALLRQVRSELSHEDSVQSSLARRIDRFLAASPGEGRGMRLAVGPSLAARTFEEFLSSADAEGFKGDRVLFTEAVAHLRKLSKREPVFEHGFLVPTFDAVEAAFALDEAIGGCSLPLVPGVYVGVGVTPTDALEFWAAPYLRAPTSRVGCIDDLGHRDVVERAAGRGPMLAALTSAIDAAHDRLPALLDAARDAERESVDPAKVLAPLHLPKTFVERAKRHGADALLCSRLTVALALCAAGEDASPLVARKLSFAAGRALARSGGA